MKVLVPIAHGSEDLEAVTIIDVLRRAKLDVVVAKIASNGNETEGMPLQVEMSRKTKIIADMMIEEAVGEAPFDMIALPGGMPGATKLFECEVLGKLLKEQKESDRFIAAICAAPCVVLDALEITKGCEITCYPSFAPKLKTSKCKSYFLSSFNAKIVDVDKKVKFLNIV